MNRARQLACAAIAALVVGFTARSAAAQVEAPPPVTSATPAYTAQPDPSYAVESDGSKPAPPARTGFQIAVRPGVAIPMGSVLKDANGKTEAMSDSFGPQFSTTIDIGAKIIPQLFLGGYLGVNVGGVGGVLSDACKAANASCSSVSLRIGIEAQYHIIPDGKINPWVGYGIGFESSAFSFASKGLTTSSGIAGPEFAHLMGGVDFRLTKVFGLGPYADLSVAQYTSTSGSSQEIKDKALHEWLTLGVKFIFFP